MKEFLKTADNSVDGHSHALNLIVREVFDKIVVSFKHELTKLPNEKYRGWIATKNNPTPNSKLNEFFTMLFHISIDVNEKGEYFIVFSFDQNAWDKGGRVFHNTLLRKLLLLSSSEHTKASVEHRVIFDPLEYDIHNQYLTIYQQGKDKYTTFGVEEKGLPF